MLFAAIREIRICKTVRLYKTMTVFPLPMRQTSRERQQT